MTTHTDLIARLREMAGRLRLEAADALESLEQQVAALMERLKEEREMCAVIAKRYEPDERSDYVDYPSDAIRSMT